jgi:hypothetical protein
MGYESKVSDQFLETPLIYLLGRIGCSRPCLSLCICYKGGYKGLQGWPTARVSG